MPKWEGAGMKRTLSVSLFLFLSVLVAFSGSNVYAQQADRAVITGIVTDSSGAPVPDAKVTITSQDTGSKTIVGTNSAGNYSTPPLTLGTYTLEVEKDGFKLASSHGIVVTGAQTYRQDVQLQLGSVTQSVTVEGGAEQLNTENATVSHTIGEAYYRDLPAAMGSSAAASLLRGSMAARPWRPKIGLTARRLVMRKATRERRKALFHIHR